MMKTAFGLLRHVWQSDAFSSTAFVARAVIIAVLFCISELAGLREYTTFLSGTSANLNVSWQTAATLGLIHLLLYVAFILLVPVFLITAGLLLFWGKWIWPNQALDQAASRQGKTGGLPRTHNER